MWLLPLVPLVCRADEEVPWGRPKGASKVCPPHGSSSSEGWIPRHVYYTGRFDSDLQHLVYHSGRNAPPPSQDLIFWPPNFEFYYFNDSVCSRARQRAPRVLWR